MGSVTRELVLRPASRGDRELLLAWRNEPHTRAASRTTATISPEEHAAWLEQVLADPDRHLLIAQLDTRPIGQVRLDRVKGYRYEISTSVDPAFRRQGLGPPLIDGAARWLWEKTNASSIEANVREENDASYRAFLNAGFRPTPGAGAGLIRLQLPRPEPWAPETPSRRKRRIRFTG